MLTDIYDQIVVDFSASWCMPCKMIAPIYQEMSVSDQFSESKFLQVDVDQNPEIAKEYEVLSMPTFVLIRNGKVLSRFSGANVEKLRSEVLKYQ